MVDPAFDRTDRGWTGVALDALVPYELHVGTHTRGGTSDAVIPQLPRLRARGVTALEPMPIAQFPGTRNWGHDGVLPFAAQHSYGGLRGLQRLVDASPALGIGVILDVVHDHSAVPFVEELTAIVHARGAALGPRLLVSGETGRNDPRFVLPPERGGHGMDAIWCDDLHQALHAAVTGERHGIFADFDDLARLAAAWATGMSFRGERSAARRHRHSRPLPQGVSPAQVVVHAQDHDQIGNRGRGERLGTPASVATPGRCRTRNPNGPSLRACSMRGATRSASTTRASRRHCSHCAARCSAPAPRSRTSPTSTSSSVSARPRA